MKRERIMLMTAAAALGLSTARADDVEDLRWMTGSWASDSAGVRIEEHWSAPAGGTMLGMHRDLRGTRTTGFEFFRIRRDSVGLVFLAQPGGRPPHPFRLKEMKPRFVVFEDPEHDFPQRLIYWLDARGHLHARAEGMVNGRLESEQWRWRRSSLEAPRRR